MVTKTMQMYILSMLIVWLFCWRYFFLVFLIQSTTLLRKTISQHVWFLHTKKSLRKCECQSFLACGYFVKNFFVFLNFQSKSYQISQFCLGVVLLSKLISWIFCILILPTTVIKWCQAFLLTYFFGWISWTSFQFFLLIYLLKLWF